MTLIANTTAPDFSLKDEKGDLIRLSDFTGKPVVLYFYPKDDTPGCTTEACNFRDDYSKFSELGAVILGISPDSEKSHAKFAAKHKLPFTLLVDENHKICDLYGVWGSKKFMGRQLEGVLRTTFLIDKDGKIVMVFEGVKPANHSEEVIAALSEII